MQCTYTFSTQVCVSFFFKAPKAESVLEGSFQNLNLFSKSQSMIK